MQKNKEQQNQEVQNNKPTIEDRLEQLDCFLMVLFDDFFRNNPEVGKDEQEASEKQHDPVQETKEETIEDKLDRLKCDVCFLYGEYLESQGRPICNECMAEIFVPLANENSIEARLSRLEDVAFILIEVYLKEANCLRIYVPPEVDRHPCLFCPEGCELLFMADIFRERRPMIQSALSNTSCLTL